MAGTPYRPFFVYGTLLPQQPNYYLWGHHILRQETAVFVNGRLYDMGHYPMLVESSTGIVKGLLVTVHRRHYDEVMAQLDQLEGFDPEQPGESTYRRLERTVQLSDGRSQLAWVYIGQEKYVNDGCKIIENGDWVNHTTGKRAQMDRWWRRVSTVAGLHDEK
jgi:gamma-glutamylcyclotransferase (GGCT)/AIG2-like uncharacterized protein YtfP